MSTTKALFILPHHDFYDEEYTKIKDFLEQASVQTEVCSTHMSEAQGRFKTIVNPDFLVRDVRARDYEVYIFVGGEGARELYHDADVSRLVKEILSMRKILVMIGETVPLLYYTNLAAGKKVTTLESLKSSVEAAGAYYTGTNVEQDGDLITGFDERAVDEINRAILRALEWQTKVR